MRVMLAAALLPAAVSGEEPPVTLESWPQNWVETYRKFETFLAEQARYVPASGLEILPDGTILHAIPLSDKSANRPGISFYQNGSQVLDMVAGGTLFGEARKRIFRSGTYAAGMHYAGAAGYQFLCPLVWFQIYSPKTEENSTSREQDSLRVRMIDPPQPAEDYWPNKRMLRFLDFHIFPNRHRDDVYKKNSRVTPDVVLSVTNSGAIVRAKLDEPLERLLRWWIYQNGRLIEHGTAEAEIRREPLREPGSYIAFVGVDGPQGFMPVSNVLKFPLFPEKDGKMAVLPSATNTSRVPDFLLDVISHDQLLDHLAKAPPGGNEGGYYNNRFIYTFGSVGPFADREKEALFQLWSAWCWKINNAKEGGSLNGMRIEPDEK
jgi:hypothetical protein